MIITISWCKKDTERELDKELLHIEILQAAQVRRRERVTITDAQSPRQPNPS